MNAATFLVVVNSTGGIVEMLFAAFFHHPFYTG
jgi:hypothetical protein